MDERYGRKEVLIEKKQTNKDKRLLKRLEYEHIIKPNIMKSFVKTFIRLDILPYWDYSKDSWHPDYNKFSDLHDNYQFNHKLLYGRERNRILCIRGRNSRGTRSGNSTWIEYTPEWYAKRDAKRKRKLLAKMRQHGVECKEEMA